MVILSWKGAASSVLAVNDGAHCGESCAAADVRYNRGGTAASLNVSSLTIAFRPESEKHAVPELPSERFANAFLETTYVYTQGRYCLVDWVQVREWHQFRDSICHAASMSDPEAQTGALYNPRPQNRICWTKRLIRCLLHLDDVRHRRAINAKSPQLSCGKAKPVALVY